MLIRLIRTLLLALILSLLGGCAGMNLGPGYMGGDGFGDAPDFTEPGAMVGMEPMFGPPEMGMFGPFGGFGGFGGFGDMDGD